MRDVIVVGAGGGGAVVAKELSQRGLDVLLLEAGPRWAHTEKQWSHYEAKANNPASGYFRFGPSNLKNGPWRRDLPQYSYLWQTGGVGGSTVHYFGNCPRPPRGIFAGGSGDYDSASLPVRVRGARPYYEWVEHTLPVQTAPMGTKEEVFLRGATRMGLPAQTGKDISGGRLPRTAERHPPAGGHGGKEEEPEYPAAKGCTFCGHCIEGCLEPRARRATCARSVRLTRATCRWLSRPTSGGRGSAVSSSPTPSSCASNCSRPPGLGRRCRGVTWRSTRNGRETIEEARVVVLAGGSVETPRLWLRSGLPNPNDLAGAG